jgi:hypothetical protein
MIPSSLPAITSAAAVDFLAGFVSPTASSALSAGGSGLTSASDAVSGSADQAVTEQLLGGSAGAPSPAEQALTARLLDGVTGAPSLLAQLTNTSYSSSDPPDYLAVSTGPGVTPKFAGGYTSVGWDLDGADVTLFTTGQQPNVTKGVAITYANDASPASRQATVAMAQTYLGSGDCWYRKPA